MSLRMVIGRSRTDKSEFIREEIEEKLATAPLGKPIFYIVPEQMTFQQEYALLNEKTLKGSVRAQVVSFSRLAWRVLQETGGSTKQFISSTGTQMMLRKIINQRTEPFKMFQKSVDKSGFIEELEGIITEFKRHCITPELLLEHIEYTEQNVALNNKLLDLYDIYSQLMGLLKDKYIDGEDQLTILAEKIKQTSFLQDAHIYIDGFHRFTPNELNIISELLLVADSVTVTLTTDEQEINKSPTELDLFFQTTETYHALVHLAEELGISLESSIELQSDDEQVEENLVFSHLETNFDVRPAPSYHSDVSNHLSIAEAIHPRAEIDGVVQEILKLVRDDNYRYRDIAIFVREPDTYHNLIKTVFEDYDIPFFIDEKRTMLNHPLIEFIRSFLDVVETNWRYDAVFRLLKTGYNMKSNEKFPLDVAAIDQLENYCLEYGIRSKQNWTQDEKWIYQRFRGFTEAKQTDRERRTEERINAYRQQVTEAFLPFDEKIRKKQTVVKRCELIYGLLEHLNIPLQLEENMRNYEEQGLIEKAREEEQVWNACIQLLDEMVEMIGDETISMQHFREIIEAGFESLEFSHVPPTLDHVIVASIDHSRIGHKKCVFLLGVNEGTWPMKPAIDGMINEKEREFLKQFGLKLAESNRRVLLDDTFYMYLAFTTATEKMCVSYTLADDEGQSNSPSLMIPRLIELYPTLDEITLWQDPDELQEASRFITTAIKTRGPLTSQLARYLRGYTVEPIWWSVLDWYMANEPNYELSTTFDVLQSLFYKNKPSNLSKKTVEKLYPKKINASVSRLEMLYRCSYQHYVQYSLGLEERRTYSLEAPDIGQLFHEALKTITLWLQQEGKDFAALTKQDSHQYAEKSMTYLAPALQHKILSSSNRYQYIQRKLQEIIAQATFILSEQARVSGFSPVGVELGFGLEAGDLEAVTIPLQDGYEVVLRGRIDRVDQALLDEQLYLRIIDYKSSSRGLDLIEVYYGLALQMLTYLSVVLGQSEQWLGKQALPAGILYFHVHNPLIQNANNLNDEQIEQQILKEFKMKGYMTSTEKVAQQMDLSVTSGRSDVAPFGLKQDGTFYADSKVVAEETFILLQQHMHRLIEQAGFQIISGQIDLNPYETKEGHACRFCDFKSVCQFDPTLNENNYRKLKPLREKEILEQLRNLKSENN